MRFSGNEMTISNQNVNTGFVLDLVKIKKSHILKSMHFFKINEHKDTEELTRLYLSPTATISGQISGRQVLFLKLICYFL